MLFEPYILIPMVVLIAGGAFAAGWHLNNRMGQNKIAGAEERSKKILADADRDAANIKKEKLLEVKDEWYRKKQEFEQEANAKRGKLQSFEKQLASREDNLERKVELINKKDRELSSLRQTAEERLKQVEEKSAHVARLIQEENQKLERVASLSRDEAKKLLIENLVVEAKSEAAQTLKDARDAARLEARKEAQKIIIQAIQR